MVLGAALLMSAAAVMLVTLRARRRTARLRNAFRCKIAVAARPGDPAVHWPRQTCYGLWVHDVLVLFSGLARTKAQTYAVHFAEGAVETSPMRVKGLGPWPVMLAMQLDDGRHALLAADRAAGALVAGPFLAALMPTRKPVT